MKISIWILKVRFSAERLVSCCGKWIRPSARQKAVRVGSYVDEVKMSLLGVSGDVLAEKTAVSEEVAQQMVTGACRALNTDYAIAATGIAGPGGGTKENPVGTIWLACGTPEKQVTLKVEEDHGRDINLAIATNKAMELFLEFLKTEPQPDELEG